MNRSLVAFSLSVLLVGWLSYSPALIINAQAQESAKRGTVQVAERSFDFGSAQQGQKVVHEFEIRNIGNGELRIQGLNTTCGCTAATVGSPVILPGASDKIKVEFDSAGFSGNKTKSVEVLTNDPRLPSFVLTIKGNIVPGATARPVMLEFGRITQSASEEERRRSFTVDVPETVDATINSVHIPSPYLQVQEVTHAGRRASYTVTLLPQAPRGPFRDRLVVEFSGTAQPALNIPIVAFVEGDLIVSPATVSFGVVSGVEPIERRVKFENRSKQAVSIESLSSSDAAVTATLVDSQPGKSGVIVVRVDPSKVTSDMKATVEIATNHPTERVVFLNVFGVLPPKQ
jgi:Protein of unknown function (DUF1573)